MEVKYLSDKKIGSIERVGGDGYIVEAAEDDAGFHNGKRLFHNFNGLVGFLSKQLGVIQDQGLPETDSNVRDLHEGGNGRPKRPISLY